MPTEFWSKKQDPQCISQIKELKDQLEALGKVVEELSSENGRLREELQTRSTTADNDLSQMELRLIARIEEIEERLLAPVDYSTDEAKTGDAQGGLTIWSERKRAAKQSQADPKVFTNPEKFKERYKKPAPAEEK